VLKAQKLDEKQAKSIQMEKLREKIVQRIEAGDSPTVIARDFKVVPGDWWIFPTTKWWSVKVQEDSKAHRYRQGKDQAKSREVNPEAG
jgi:hypothetical protein